MKRRICSLALSLVFALLLGMQAAGPIYAQAASQPETEYARSFLAACEGQQWFIDEVERLLNVEQKTLNTVTGSGDFANIRSLGLRDRGITGSIPPAIGELTNLRYLFLSGNQLSGTIPDSLFALTKLENIDLGGNAYDGAIPAGFGTMPALKILILKDNAFTGTIPDTILSNTQIQVLDLKGNQLSGGIPAELAGMTGLTYLNLSGNKLGGPLPDLSALTGLVTLSAWDCDLTGSIPDSIYSLTALQILDLSGNRLDGELSGSLADLTQLEYLALDGNRLRGALPDAFAGGALTDIRLSDNCFRGIVPNSLKVRDDAGAEVYLERNYMTGADLKALEHNEGNFADDASTQQYRLTASKTQVQLSETGKVDLYALLQNKPLGSGGTKPLLPPEEYEVVCDPVKVEITVNADGIYAEALTEIPLTEDVTVTIQIKDNDGSEYSKVKLTVTTNAVPTGGGSGGGGEPEPEKSMHKRYINGYPNGTFRPETSVTREQVAKMLVSALEKEPERPAVPTYSDVPTNNWSYGWVEAARREGFMAGYGNGRFGLGRPITRAELATALVRIAADKGLVLSDDSRGFSDVKPGRWYSTYVDKAARYGLITGYSDGTFRPERYVSRAEAVVMINRLLARTPKTAPALQDMTSPFSDVEGHWAYLHILEAAVDHEHEDLPGE